MSAVCHLHERGILHNDIKSNNFVIEEREMKTRPVLIDFGKATTASKSKGCETKRDMTLAERHQYRQKYPHIAPEISLGKAQTELTDTYSFGYVFCTTMKSLDNMRKLAVENERLHLLKIGQLITHNNPKKRGNLQDALTVVNAITRIT
ncbi:probable serine/threonine-protein kinase DDB_G0271402 [Actinia tenebrosa]|uniref:Probable serine/threonine-protein kinase DDB_G0271402 n=1 Tax=Actinia tenebrosa TaxID=6105 RepID=A0A6P8HNU0_ACTTE|nr:probable serine/threonine-protein kinase DDB_G0271402 [Actinia tenebrosa]